MEAKGSGISRRQALRAGAYVAGAAWVVPAVTVIGAGPASADSPSGQAPPQQPQVKGEQYERGVPTTAEQPSSLAYTGANVGGAAMVGAGLVAGGAALAVASRRRQPATAAGSTDGEPSGD